MKLITFTVPCYNSAAYMDRCIRTLLHAGEEAEILLVDDGSTDDTGAIADGYAARYPDMVRVIHQENGGHGEGVNQGIRNAAGLYFKVVDSDDWVDEAALDELMELLRTCPDMETPLDLIVCNYVYEHAEDHTRRAMRYRNVMPAGEPFTWEQTGRFTASQFITMHAAIYRTQVLRDSGIVLPKHTFYVDNIYVYQPLPSIKTLYYLDADLYRYFIGRADQTVTEESMIRNIDQQIRVTKIIADAHDLEALRRENRKLAQYMYHFLSIMVMICTIYMMLSGTEENLAKSRALWAWLRQNHPVTYRRMRYLSANAVFLAPGKAGRRVNLYFYRKVRHRYKFN